MEPYNDRREAGRQLAARLADRAGRPDVRVLALPRGGTPVAFEVARRLGVPLDVFIVRKVGVPWYPELAMGAVASGGVRVMNDDVVGQLGISQAGLDDAVAGAQRDLTRCEAAYREGRPATALRDCELIVVDDGLATGATMRAAVSALRQRQPARIVVAVPVGAAAICRRLEDEADEVVCLLTPQPFHAVRLWYRYFPQTDDETVRELLREAGSPPPSYGQGCRPPTAGVPSAAENAPVGRRAR